MPTSTTEIPFAVSDWKPMVKGALRGFFNLELPSGMVIHNCMLMEKAGTQWVNLPSKEFTKRDGSRGWVPILEIPDRSRRDWFNQQCIRALTDEGVL